MLSLKAAVTIPVTDVESLSGFESVSPALETDASTVTSPLRLDETTRSTVAELPGDIGPNEQTTSEPFTLQLPWLAVTETTLAPVGRCRWSTAACAVSRPPVQTPKWWVRLPAAPTPSGPG